MQRFCGIQEISSDKWAKTDFLFEKIKLKGKGQNCNWLLFENPYRHLLKAVLSFSAHKKPVDWAKNKDSQFKNPSTEKEPSNENPIEDIKPLVMEKLTSENWAQ